jgi:hypothetical protein
MKEKQTSGEPRTVGGAEASECLIDLAQRVIDERRKALESEFGWTCLRATVQVRPDARQLVVEGEAIRARIIGQLRQDLLAALPPGFRLSMPNFRPLAGGPWRYLSQGVTRLQRCLPSSGRPVTLTTELLPEDGPVQCLATQDAAVLVRTVDGTIGWTTSPLGPTAARPRTGKAQFGLLRLQRWLRSYLGVPYLLGGATRSGIDCSALAQRCLRTALDAVIPRHSLDQLRAAGSAGRPVGEPGDLVYVWARGDSACHVGVVLDGDRRHRRTVIHASASRRRVVEESLDVFLARADRAAHVELAQILDQHPCLLDA